MLSATSGGIDLSAYDAHDWRPAMRAAQPDLPDWFIRCRDDLTSNLATLRIPTLLLWGDADPISPVAVGERLAGLLPRAQLHVFPAADHSLGSSLASRVAPLIDAHLLSEHS
ncbi:alpha/beta fold hydrolase [Massilia sp. Se16.2.3]|uniref:alpha/beta fold hydrolase n=1 Tax=Massilia sp. Se16.2.3 TaxID=2709303 RepID=UPI0028056641|nr:alpha/beta fold hydrolase [Massilia sp. Se16.2.3]